MEKIITKRLSVPCGNLLLGSFGDGLCLCRWEDGKRSEQQDKRIQAELQTEFRRGTSPVLKAAAAQLKEYFGRKRTEFDIPLIYAGTGFQKKVWDLLLSIPYGTTISYRRLAEKTGDPKAVRAVAGAVARNPLSIFVPCHRVIGSDQKLVGYGGGLDAKNALLAVEGVILPF